MKHAMKPEDGVPTEVRTLTDFVCHVENALGWLPAGRRPIYLERSMEVAKLKRKIATRPKLYTLANLMVTVEWLRRRHMAVSSPAAICWHAERALAEAEVVEVPSDLDAPFNAALVTEMTCTRRHDVDWVARLTRSSGPARWETYQEWLEAHRD
jgi:hypothetical protein